MRKALVALLLPCIAIGIGYLFWHDDWKYSLPTPIPADYHAVPTGTAIEVGDQVPGQTGKPVFLHFFNPRCPCSRFNLPQFAELARTYGDRISFGVVVLSPDDYTVEEIQDKIGMDLPVSFDRSLAVDCGVYSTPQAVLMDAGHKLYYRGNYNKSRYCTDRATSYARMAIDSLLDHHAELHPERAALTSYGCSLTNCKK